MPKIHKFTRYFTGGKRPRKQLVTKMTNRHQSPHTRRVTRQVHAKLQAEKREQRIEDRKNLRRHLSTRRSEAVITKLEIVEKKEQEQLDALCAESYKSGHKSGYKKTTSGFIHHQRKYRKAIQEVINHYAIDKNKLNLQLAQIDTTLEDGQFICSLCRYVQSNSGKRDRRSDNKSIHLGSSNIKIKGNVCCCQDEQERCKFCQVPYNHNETVPSCTICCRNTYKFKKRKHRTFEGCGCDYSPKRDQCQDCHDVFCVACAGDDFNLMYASENCGTLCESCQAEHYDGYRCHTCPSEYNR